MKRVLVIGSGGAGKTTLSRALSKRPGLPVIHLDVHFWRPGWVQPAPEEWSEQVDRLVAERPDLAPGCEERGSIEFLRWIWSYPTQKRPRVLERLAGLRPDQRLVHLRSGRDVNDFLAGVAG